MVLFFEYLLQPVFTANFSMQDELVKLGCTQLTIVVAIWIISALILAL